MIGFLRELRRRRVLRTAGLYIVGAWLVLQAADVFFPGWGLPDSALNVLLVAAILGFPLALVFGWFFDVTAHGIVRTPGADAGDSGARLPLQRSDYAVLGALLLIAGLIAFETTQEIIEAPRVSVDGGTPDDLVPREMIESSVAVLPFANISNETENEAFCDGISEEILNQLAAFADLHVIGRTSSFAFKNSDYRIPRISALLGVRYLLQGSVRKHGDQLRISAQLVDQNGVQRWSDTFDRTLDNIFAIQSEIATVVATTVAPQIVPPQRTDYEPGIEAYQHFLVGRERVRKRDDAAARDELRQAIDLDPDFAEARAEYAITLLLGLIDTSSVEEAGAEIEKALSLQPNLARGFAARGLYLQRKPEPDWAASEIALRRALELDPGMVDAMNWLTNPLGHQGKLAESTAMLEQAMRIDPLHSTVVGNLATQYARQGETDRAEQMLLRLLELPDPGHRPFQILRDIYHSSGQLEKMNAIEKRSALGSPRHYYGLAFSYALLDLADSAAYWTERMNREFPDFFFTGYSLANVPMWQGDYDEAASLFEHELARRNADLDRLDPYYTYYYGLNKALAGDYAGAVEVLERHFGNDDRFKTTGDEGIEAMQVLAWSLSRSGAPDEAAAIFASTEQWIERESVVHDEIWSPRIILYAENAILMGKHDVALDRLERAIEIGWRDYYTKRHDPRWEALHGNPRYESLMAEVKADVDRQRAVVQQRDREEDFVALLDKVRESRKTDQP